MRARWVKPEFFRDRKIGQLGPVAALVFEALWVVSDDYGTAPCDPEQLKGDMFMMWSAVGVPEITGALRQLDEGGRITRFKVGDETFCRINNWEKHQAVHKPSQFRYPAEGEPLTAESAESSGTGAESSGTPHLLDSQTPRHLDTYSRSGAGAPIDDEQRRKDWVSFHLGVIRDAWPDQSDAEMKTNASILHAIWNATAGNPGIEMEAAIRGLLLITRVGKRPSMRLLYSRKESEGGIQVRDAVFPRAVQAYYEKLKGPPRTRDGVAADPVHISATLDRVMGGAT